LLTNVPKNPSKHQKSAAKSGIFARIDSDLHRPKRLSGSKETSFSVWFHMVMKELTKLFN